MSIKKKKMIDITSVYCNLSIQKLTFGLNIYQHFIHTGVFEHYCVEEKNVTSEKSRKTLNACN